MFTRCRSRHGLDRLPRDSKGDVATAAVEIEGRPAMRESALLRESVDIVHHAAQVRQVLQQFRQYQQLLRFPFYCER
jgi:hypothetical protein